MNDLPSDDVLFNFDQCQNYSASGALQYVSLSVSRLIPFEVLHL